MSLGDSGDLTAAVIGLGVAQIQRAEYLRTRPGVCTVCAGSGDRQQIDVGPDDTTVSITRCQACHGFGLDVAQLQFYVAADGNDEPTIWYDDPRHPGLPVAVVRRCDIRSDVVLPGHGVPGPGRAVHGGGVHRQVRDALWLQLTAGLEIRPGDDEPAEVEAVDLVAALRASVEAAKERRARGDR